MPKILAVGRTLAAAVVLLCGPAAAQVDLLAPASPAGLSLRQAEILRLFRAEPGVVSVEVAVVDAAALAAGGPVAVALPGGGRLVLAPTSTEARADGLSWAGRPAGEGRPADATGLFVVRDGNVTGILRSGATALAVRPLTGGLHAVGRLTPDVLAPHGGDYEAWAGRARPRVLAPAVPGAPAGRGIHTVDVLVPYTADVSAAYADPAAFAQLAVDQANASFEVSGIGMRLALVGTYALTDASTGTTAGDLAALEARTDGRFDGVHARRDETIADLVAMIGPATYPDNCGRGYLVADANTAFSVTGLNCTVAAFAFAHEIGHNAGAQHDPFVATNLYFPYGHGSVNVAGRWRTVMAYSNECTAAGVECPVVGYWASPDVVYPDATPPVNAGPTGDAAVRHDARVLDERAAVMAGFRVFDPTNVLGLSADTLRAVVSPGGTATVVLTVRNTAPANVNARTNWRGYLVGGTPAEPGDCLGGYYLDGDPSEAVQTVAEQTEVGQTFRMPCSGVLETLQIVLLPPTTLPAGEWAAGISLFSGTSTRGIPVRSSERIQSSGAAAWVRPVYLGGPLDVRTGETYTWFLDMVYGARSVRVSTADPYPGGQMVASSTGTPDTAVGVPGRDVPFVFDTSGPVRWATVSSAPAGTLFSGQTADVRLTLDAAGLPAGTYRHTFVVVSDALRSGMARVPVLLTVASLAGEAEQAGGLALNVPRPNPARGRVAVGFSLPAAGPAWLTLVDVLGREVAVLVAGDRPAGPGEAIADTGRFAPGVYAARLAAGGRVLARPFVVVR